MAPENAYATERKMEEVACRIMAGLIRKKSGAGQLLLQKEILQELREQKALKSDHREQKGKFEAILKKTMEENGAGLG